MRVSVIVPTYNRADKIGNLMDSLLMQTVKDFEVIVVVDGSTDNTVEILEPYKNLFPQFQLITNQNQGRSKTRNAGAHAASGELLIFYDDDVVADNDSVYRHMKLHRELNKEIILAGSQRELEGEMDIQKYRAYLTPLWFSKYKEDITRLNLNNLFFAGANCSINRKTFDQVNGFDSRLSDGEDFDFAIRALKAQVPVYYDKNNVVTHCDLVTCKKYIQRQREYAMAREERNKINDLKRERIFFKHLLYRPFAFNFWVKAIDKDYFVKLPRIVRYKLYDVVIHALSVEYSDVKL